MPIKLISLIAQVSAEVETTVKTVRTNKQLALKAALRAECRLVLPTTEDGEDVQTRTMLPVSVLAGYPVALRDIEIPDDFELGLLLGSNRTAIERARVGTEGLLKLRERMVEHGHWQDLIGASEAELQATYDWAGALLELLKAKDPMAVLLQVREDILGVYEYSHNDTLPMFGDAYSTNRASISLYWGVIGLVAKWMDCKVEDLTIVVLTHELAHAYTQLGADINKQRWPASLFAKAETALKEGLAQYYTDRALTRLGRPYTSAYEVFVRLQVQQPEAYRAHLGWLEHSTPEAVRRAILEARRHNVLTLEEFQRRLDAAQNALEPQAEQPKAEHE